MREQTKTWNILTPAECRLAYFMEMGMEACHDDGEYYQAYAKWLEDRGIENQQQQEDEQ